MKTYNRELALFLSIALFLSATIRTVIKNVLDPGSTVAEWLDKRDYKPRNGFVDVKGF